MSYDRLWSFIVMWWYLNAVGHEQNLGIRKKKKHNDNNRFLQKCKNLIMVPARSRLIHVHGPCCLVSAHVMCMESAFSCLCHCSIDTYNYTYMKDRWRGGGGHTYIHIYLHWYIEACVLRIHTTQCTLIQILKTSNSCSVRARACVSM
jgi:hypothetical protein